MGYKDYMMKDVEDWEGGQKGRWNRLRRLDDKDKQVKNAEPQGRVCDGCNLFRTGHEFGDHELCEKCRRRKAQ